MNSSQELLRSGAPFGDYFAVADQPSAGWPTLAALVGDADGLNERVSEARAALAAQTGHAIEAVEPRVAASVWFLGFAARIISPPFGAAVVTGRLPLLSPEQVWTPPTGPYAMIANGTTVSADLYEVILVGLVAPLVDSVCTTFVVSPRVLWGNVASCLAGAATVIGLTRPDLALRARVMVEDLLQDPSLDGTGKYPSDGFRRNTCCLYYRLPNGGLCGDCVLRAT